MSIQNKVLLSNISAESIDSVFSISDKQSGAGYNSRGDALHTVVYDVDSFIGVIKLQATLALYPDESDWFDIEETTIGLNSDSSAWTSLTSINFIGNFVWIRAAYNIQNGIINKIRYNY